MMFNWQSQALSAAELVSRIPEDAHVFVQGAAMTPTPLLKALCLEHDKRVNVYHLHIEGEMYFEQAPHVRSYSFFVGAAMRSLVNSGRAEFIPIFLKDIPSFFRKRVVDLDSALVRVSPPDAHGYCSLGTSVDATLQACLTAKQIFAVVDEKVPRTRGNSFIPFNRITGFCLDNSGPILHKPAERDAVEETIGTIIAELVEDGSTLQMGIGAIPDAVLSRLHDKHDLGIHTEMFTDSVVDLVAAGAVTNRFKKVHAGRLVTTFVVGSEKLYRFVDDNPSVEFHPCDRTNETSLIRQNPRVVAINSAISVDLSGQVQADSIGHSIFSGIGGQMDFIHGASLSEGGKPIIALPATAKSGTVSRISATLPPGAGVVTTRGHVHWVVTEFGAVNLFGQSLRARGERLISIAHPDFRGELRKELCALRHFVL